MEPLTVESTPTDPGERVRIHRSCCTGSHRSRLFVGLLLIGLGALFALSTYGFVDVRPLALLWPLFLIVPGAGLLVRTRGRRGLVLLLLGMLFLVQNFGLLPIDARLFPASILLIVGFALIVSSLLSRTGPGIFRPPSSQTPSS